MFQSVYPLFIMMVRLVIAKLVLEVLAAKYAVIAAHVILAVMFSVKS